MWFCSDSVIVPSWLHRTLVPSLVVFVVPHVVSGAAKFRSISFSQRAITKSIIAPVNGPASWRLSFFEIRRHRVTASFLHRRTMAQNNHESEHKNWATRSYVRPFAGSVPLVSLARSVALIRSLDHSLTHSQICSKVYDKMTQNDLISSHSAASWRLSFFERRRRGSALVKIRLSLSTGLLRNHNAALFEIGRFSKTGVSWEPALFEARRCFEYRFE